MTLIKPWKCTISGFDFYYDDVDFHLEKTVEEEEGGEGRHCQPANHIVIIIIVIIIVSLLIMIIIIASLPITMLGDYTKESNHQSTIDRIN